MQRLAGVREVAHQFRGGGYRQGYRPISGDQQPLGFHAEKDEQLSFDHRPADVAAEIVETDFGDNLRGGIAGGRLQSIPGVEDVVADVLKQSAVPGVAAAPCDNVDGRAVAAAVFSRIVRGLDIDFLNEIDTDVVHLRTVGAAVHVEGAIHGPKVAVATLAVYDGRIEPLAGGKRSLVEVPLGDRGARNQRGQLNVVAFVQRQVQQRSS